MLRWRSEFPRRLGSGPRPRQPEALWGGVSSRWAMFNRSLSTSLSVPFTHPTRGSALVDDEPNCQFEGLFRTLLPAFQQWTPWRIGTLAAAPPRSPPPTSPARCVGLGCSLLTIAARSTPSHGRTAQEEEAKRGNETQGFLATRKPVLTLVVAGVPLNRSEERTLPALRNHEPPRRTRVVPVAGPEGLTAGLDA